MTRKITPWGKVQFSQTFADGIIAYSTASHGGLWISAKRRKAMPEAIRSKETFAGGNWYEEDCDFALVVLSFPEYFSDRAYAGAVDTAKR